MLVDKSAEDVETKIDKEKLSNVIRDVLSELTPREETVLRLRFGICEENYKSGEKVNADA
jgi:DNA-directed RNA polymerase sigma subunit (sigma70/sigma32)